MTIRKHKQWNASRKPEMAIVLIWGEPLDEVSRLTGQSAQVLQGWKETFLQSGQDTLDVNESPKAKGVEAVNTSLNEEGLRQALYEFSARYNAH